MFDKKLLLQHIENRQRTVEEQNRLAEQSLAKTLKRAAQTIVGKALPGEGGIASTPAQQFDRIQRKRSRMSQDREERAASDEKSAEQEQQAAIKNVPEAPDTRVRVQTQKGRESGPWSFNPPVEAQYKMVDRGMSDDQKQEFNKAGAERRDAIKTAGEKMRSAEKARYREQEFRAGLEFKDPKKRPDF